MEPTIPEAIPTPGLTTDAPQTGALSKDLHKRTAIYFYKRRLPCLFVAFMGGTGTGKSTLFNALCNALLSETGMERPKTSGPIIYAHKDCPLGTGFPLPDLDWVHHKTQSPATGSLSRLTIISHDRAAFSHLAIIDTPDLDSVTAQHRNMALDLYHLSDAVVFVTSQEKYADQVPHQFLQSVIAEGPLLFVLFNKFNNAESETDVREILNDLTSHRSLPQETHLWVIPYLATPDVGTLSRTQAFKSFRESFMKDLSKGNLSTTRHRRHRLQAEQLQRELTHLLRLIEMEQAAGIKWRSQLETLCQEISRDLITDEKSRFSTQSREYLKREIRRLFDRYDILSRPRRFVKEIVTAPLRLLGIKGKAKPDSRANLLSRIRKRTDLSNVHGAVEKLHRRVLEELSPKDPSAPLYSDLRDPALKPNAGDIQKMVWNEQERLADWLEEQFAALAKGIPKSKRVGIYSISLLWGILIVSFETAVGGGFTLVDALLDSAIAPFITKGTVELFAYHEIQKIARELSRQYQDGLTGVVTHQCGRYAERLERLLPDDTTVKTIREMQSKIKAES